MGKTTVVSYSEVFKWQTCQRQYYYGFSLGLQSIDTPGPMDLGNKGHKLLQNFHEFLRTGVSKDEALELVGLSAHKMAQDGKDTDFNLLKAWIFVDNYIRKTDFTSEAELIENRFLLPATALTNDPAMSHVQIGFTPDVVFRRKGGFLDVEDYKFVGRAWSQSKSNRFPQLKLYQIFLEKMGYNVSRTTLRFFNTTTAAITEKNYTMGAKEKQTLTEDFMAAVAEVVRFKDSPDFTHHYAPRTMNYTACQYCPFEFPCTLEAEGKDASKTLKTQYQKRTYDYTK